MLEAFFQPESIAVVGATRHPHGPGYSAPRNAVGCGCRRSVYPINPGATEIPRLEGFPAVPDIPDPSLPTPRVEVLEW